MLSLNLLLFAITFAGGGLPLWINGLSEKNTNYLLAFSGSFLLSITLLHLLPETFAEIGNRAGLFLLAGFFVQLLIQRFTHGVEHGHTHVHVAAAHGEAHQHDHHHHHHHHHGLHRIPLYSIILGLSVHAFMEGLPLGFHYRLAATQSSLYLAVGAHKLPEAMLLTSLMIGVRGKKPALLLLIFFSLITPLAATLAYTLGMRYLAVSKLVMWVIPVVAGAFIHIATTIFYESGTRQHLLTWSKTLAILLGVALGLLTLLLD